MTTDSTFDPQVPPLDPSQPLSPTEKRSGLADKAGELIEKVGHKISDAGAPNLGQKIHDFGDKMEKTHSDQNHPKDI